MKMIVNTQNIKQGLITINNIPIKKGQPIDFLEKELGFVMQSKGNNCGYALPLDLIEDEQLINVFVWLNDGIINSFRLELIGFNTEDEAYDVLEKWMKERNVDTLIGADDFNVFYKTDFGALLPSLVNSVYDDCNYSISIKLSDSVPFRKFSKIEPNECLTNYFNLKEHKYKVQKINEDYIDLNGYLDWFGNSVFSLSKNDEDISGDRIEVFKFLISKLNKEETVLGAVEFAYMSVSETYLDSDFFLKLDDLTQAFGIVGYVIQELGCNAFDKSKISPYILLLEGFHNEIPLNKEFDDLIKDSSFLLELFKSASKVTANYVDLPSKYLTVINISHKVDNLFNHHIKCGDTFVNYDRF